MTSSSPPPLLLRFVILLISIWSLRANNNHLSSNKKRRKPNIILFLTDDQDVVLGGADYMPYLKQHLKDEGTTYVNAFVHTPICCPSRSSILTGRYLQNGGALNNSVSGNCFGKQWRQEAEHRTFAVHAKQAGYKTFYAGKYLNQYGYKRGPGNVVGVPPGWDKWYGLVGNSVYYNYTIVESNDGGNTTKLHAHGDSYEEDYLPDLLANRTLQVLEEFLQQDQQPFLIVLAWPACHSPFTPAPWAEHIYDGKSAPRTPNWNASLETVLQKHWLVRQMAPLGPRNEETIDRVYANRLETLRSVDMHINQVMELIGSKKNDDVFNNTMFIFTSDNGFQLGQHRIQGDKRQLYEHDIRVPFIVRYGPLVQRNVTSTQIVLNIDVAPTFYHVMNMKNEHDEMVELPPDMDGKSFLDNNSNEKNVRKDFLVSYHGEGHPPCNMYTCPPPRVFHGGDSSNNTYHCVRTLTTTGSTMTSKTGKNPSSTQASENSIYCQFTDDESFVEYYDMQDQDEWQLNNKASKLSPSQIWRFQSRLAQLRSCHGESCRE